MEVAFERNGKKTNESGSLFDASPISPKFYIRACVGPPKWENYQAQKQLIVDALHHLKESIDLTTMS